MRRATMKNHKCIPSRDVCDGFVDSSDCEDFSDEDPEMCATWDCTTGMWKCVEDGICIREGLVCDGRRDCSDRSDERRCEEWDCLDGYWKCADKSRCITETGVCDSDAIFGQTCRDNSDEDPEMCKNWTCPEGYWRCKDQSKCLSLKRVCDGKSGYNWGCRDKSDESFEFCKDFECPENKWKCRDSKNCVLKIFILDGREHCDDGSDEEPAYHIGRKCPEGLFQCNTYQCIKLEYVCDGRYSFGRTETVCEDDSDEFNCEDWECLPDYWKCNDNLQCLPAHDVCDGGPDCSDLSDEHNELCGYCQGIDEWACHDGNGCAMKSEVCDGVAHCRDQSDELEKVCSTWNCSSGMWKCKNNLKCIALHEVCDAVEHCTNGSDEEQCEDWTCVQSYWKCQDNLQCVEENSVCDGRPQCSDFSDELITFCNDYECLHDHTKCADGLQCISKSNICDDEADCLDGSDELCTDSCLPSPIKYESIIRKCSENNDVCFPVERFCDGNLDCPFQSDELSSGCSCHDWGLTTCNIGNMSVCLYFPWESEVGNENLYKTVDCTQSIFHQSTSTNLTKEDMIFIGLCVMVSAEGEDTSSCVRNVSTNHCRSISYAMQHGAQAVCVQGLFSGLNEDIALVKRLHINNSSTSTLTIQCTDCIFENSILNISCKQGSDCNILFVNFIMSRCVISIQSHVQATFLNASFEETLISDDQATRPYNHIQLIFDKSILTCYDSEMCGLILSNDPILKLVVGRSELTNFKMDFLLDGLAIYIHHSKISNPDFTMRVWTFEFKRIPSIVYIKDTSLKSSEQSRIIFNLVNPFVNFENSNFESTSIEISSKDFMFDPIFFFVLVERSNFSACYHQGNGGAILIFSKVKNSKIHISQSHLSYNRARIGDAMSTGHGGALFIDTTSSNVMLDQCSFYNNEAEESGMAVYISKGASLTIHSSLFVHLVRVEDLSLQTLLVSVGNVLHFTGHIVVRNDHPSNFKDSIKVLQLEEAIFLDIHVECPPWHEHRKEYTLITAEGQPTDQLLSRLSYECSPCTDGYYSVSAPNDMIQYSTGGNASSWISQVDNTGCLKCPYGGLCPGNNIVPRPNYWGFWHKGELVFQQCPAGYCCSSSDDSPCRKHNACAGNKTGILCGSCQTGFSVSILTGECTLGSECGHGHLFWVFVVLAMFIYALWYTFKDDLFGLFFIFTKYFARSKLLTIRNKVQRLNNESRSKREDKSDRVLKLDENVSGDERNKNIGNSKRLPVKFSASIKNKNHSSNRHNSKTTEGNSNNGYFGIVTYFIQMASIMTIQIEFSEVEKGESVVDKISNNLNRFIGIDITQFSIDICPIVGLTAVGKHIFKLIFLCGIYSAWFIIFLSTFFLSKTINARDSKPVKILHSMHTKLIKGLIEIIKYIYVGFCEVIFSSLICVQIGSKFLWWYDASNICLEHWQVSMVILGIVYAIPFPLALFLGMKLLRQNEISSQTFFLSCLCPLTVLYLLYLNLHLNKRKMAFSNVKDQPTSKTGKIIISVLQGPYREDNVQMTLYWEAMVSIRRLVITAMTLVGYASIRMMIVTAFCMIFLLQHVYMMPFKVRGSNHVESFSLLLLSLNSVINLLKALMTDSGIVPAGPSVSFFKGLEFLEKILVIVLIIYIILAEVNKRRNVNKTSNGAFEGNMQEGSNFKA